MSDKQIKQFTEEATVADNDLILIQDGSDDSTKKVQAQNIVPAGTVTPEKLTSGTGTSWAWQDWTPSWTNVSVGNGTVTAQYIQIGKTVHFFLQLDFGSTTGVTGNVTFSAPVTATSDWITQHFGQSGYQDNNTGITYGGSMTFTDTSNILCRRQTVTGSETRWLTVNATNPFTWTTSDSIRVNGTYEAA